MNRSKLVPRALRSALLVIALTAGLVSLPTGAAEIYINEVMASNSTNAPLAAFPDYAPDYVELYNSSGRDIDLGAEGWSITTKNNPSFPSLPGFNFRDLYRFTNGFVFPASSYLLLFFDNETNFPGIHTTFNEGGTNVTFTLSRTGDQVKLFQGFNLVDSVIFGPQISGFSIGRVPDADVTTPTNDNFTLNIPTPFGSFGDSNTLYAANAVASFVPTPSISNELALKINEWVAFSLNNGRTNSDWLEIYNPDTNIVELSGLWILDADLRFDRPDNQVKPHTFVSPQGWVQFFADGDGDAPNAFNFSLSSTSGDSIYIYAADQTTILDRVTFAALAEANASRGRVPDGGDLIIRLQSPSPEDSNFGTIPEVVISEVLTHTDPPYEDAIELQNVTGTTVSLANWWLSNSRSNGRKYRIPGGTAKSSIPPGGYVVFYESEFNGPNAAQPFTMNSANGDECYIFKGDANGRLTGFRRGISFGPSANAVSFVRHVVSNSFETNADIVASTELTLGTGIRPTDPPGYGSLFRLGTGAANSAPRVGPIVINEVYYHPPEIPVIGGTVDDDITEYVELFNASESTVPFYDPVREYSANGNYNPAPDGTIVLNGDIYADGRTNTWRIRGGIDFDFPRNVTLAPGKFILLVNFAPTNSNFMNNFLATFPAIADRLASGEAQIFGPYGGKLSNKGADIELRRPDAPQPPARPDFRLVPYITVDMVKYEDAAPWPVTEGAAGVGAVSSIQKTSSYDYGNDPLGWFAGTPTPGTFNSTSGVEPPSIAVQPRSITTFAGRTATFSVTARGGNPQYQWREFDIPIAGATNRTYTLQNVSTNDNAELTVVITNLAGEVVSQMAELTVNPPVSDSVLPLVKITGPTYTTTTNQADIVTGTASDRNGIANVFYSLNGGQYIAVAASETFATWQTPVPVAFEQGSNVVTAYSVDNAGNQSAIASRTYFYSSRTPLTLAKTGSGEVRGATNTQMLEIGRNFQLTAVPATGSVLSNWIVRTNLNVAFEARTLNLSYKFASNMTVTANFIPNPYAPVAGKYNGLFQDTNTGVLHGSSGSFLLTTTDRGSYTASLILGGVRLSASGQLSVEGRAEKTIIRRGASDITITWAVALDGSDTVSGTVSDGTWSAILEGDRAVFSKTRPCLLAGKYTLALPGLPGDDFVPGGASYGTVTIDSNGVASLKAVLADKTTASVKSTISKNGDWPLYFPLYSGKGSVLSWITFEERTFDDFHGNLNWSKPSLPTAKYYPLGFITNFVEVIGSRYFAPITTNKVLQLTNATLILSGGNPPQEYTNEFKLGLSSRVTNSGPHTLTLSFTTASGLLKGSLTPTNVTGAKAIPFTGVVLQKSTNAVGHFLGTNESGNVSITVSP